MTPDQLELLSDMIADKVFQRIQHYIEDNYKNYIAAAEPIGPQEFFHKHIDEFGNVRYEPTNPLSKKDMLGIQLEQLKEQHQKLLKEEKYELLQELKEIYDKVKKEYDNL